MPSPEKLDPGDAVLLRYLLGVLPVDEAEPVEEASIVDDDVAARLNAMEHDLIDNYIRGEMEGSSLTKFQSWYLSSPLRAQKVEAARALLSIADSASDGVPADSTTAIARAPETKIEASEVTPASESGEAPKPVPSIVPNFSFGGASTDQKSGARSFGKLGIWPMLGFVAAAIVLIVAVGFLTNKNKQFRSEVSETHKQAPAPTPQLDDQRVPATGAQGASAHGTENLATVTLFLPAPTRGASTIPKVDVPQGTGLVVLSLGLGSTGEETYRAQVMNPTTQKVLWHSGILRPGSDGTFVSVAVPANVMHSQIYLIQLMHDAANGKPELLGTYPFRAEVK